MEHLYHVIQIRVTINNNLRFEVCNSIDISTSVQVLTNTAKIKLPRAFKNANQKGESVDISEQSILDFIKRGDAIKIEVGYDGILEVEFEGYITDINSDVPLELTCDDEMWMLKKAPKISKSFEKGNVASMIKACLPSKYTLICNEKYEVGKWVLKSMSVYELLEELKTKVGIRAYFESPTVLRVGMIVDFVPKNTWELNFSKNIRKGNDLKFERKSDHPLEVIVSAKDAKGKMLEAKAGESGGDVTRMKLPTGVAFSELQFWADKTYQSRSFDGFKGSLNIWLEPRVKCGDSIRLLRPMYADGHQDGVYFVEESNLSVNGSTGIKRSLKLGYKL